MQSRKFKPPRAPGTSTCRHPTCKSRVKREQSCHEIHQFGGVSRRFVHVSLYTRCLSVSVLDVDLALLNPQKSCVPVDGDRDTSADRAPLDTERARLSPRDPVFRVPLLPAFPTARPKFCAIFPPLNPRSTTFPIALSCPLAHCSLICLP